MTAFFHVPNSDHYWLRNGRVPLTLLNNSTFNGSLVTDRLPQATDHEAWVSVNVEVKDGKIAALKPISHDIPADVPTVDIRCGLIWPCFVDVHTHLDKGHIWPRSPNPDGTSAGAIATVHHDSSASAWRWHAEDIYRRMEFGLKCAYAHGTQAIRTHLDAFDQQGEISFEVFRQLREKWADKILLQAVCLVSLDYFGGPKGETLADLVAESGGVLGGVLGGGVLSGSVGGDSRLNDDTLQQIDRLFELAEERKLNLDLHTDESLDPHDMTLRYVAEAAIRRQFTGCITCGHCCSLSVQSDEVMAKTVQAVSKANISVVSLPMCNLYLQDRKSGRTPRYRGVSVLHELKAAGVKVAIASDNCRDPFFAYGDHDGLEVFTQSVRIGHLDHPIGDWPQSVTSIPAEMMGLQNVGQIGEGRVADLVVFKARSFSELMARGQSDRAVIRRGKQIDSTLPDYAELDDLMRDDLRR
jgi:cytosine/creatinine deaminase